MFDADSWQEIFNVVRTNRLRTLLTASGVFWGIYILIIMLGFGNGLKNGVLNNMTGYATNGYYLWGSRTSVPYQGLKPGRRIKLNNSDTEAMRKGVDEIAYLLPRVRLGSYRTRNDIGYKTRISEAEVMGDIPELKHILPMAIDTGRFINQLDIEQKRKVIVIGEKIYADLFPDGGDPVGTTVTLRQISFTVIGIFKPVRYAGEQETLSSTAFIPLTTHQKIFNQNNRVNYFGLVPKDGVPSKIMGEKAKQLLAARHRVSPSDSRALGSWSSEKKFIRLKNLFSGINYLIWTVGLATLFAGLLGVSNIMLIVIKERTKEFGIRKALGATPRSIILLITQETLLLTSIAGYLGLAAGILTLQLVDKLIKSASTEGSASTMFDSPTIEPKIALTALAVLIVSGLIAAIIPARQAVRINPVEALRAD